MKGYPSSRRDFLRHSALAAPALALPGVLRGAPAGTPTAATRPPGQPARELRADVVVVGGGMGGIAAALAAARAGRSVIMTEEFTWIGGQLTSQAVPPDENAAVETHGATRSYQDFRTRVRAYYARNYPLTDAARANRLLNPGGGSVSRLCHEPRVALAVLEEMLAPHVASGRIDVLRRHVPTAASVQGDRVEAVQVRSLETGRELVLRAPYFVDATELGDLLPLTGTEYVTGAEARADTGEPHAKPEAQPANHQSFTHCFAAEHVEGADHTIDRPAEYAFWRDYVPALTPAWPGRLLSMVYSNPRTLQPFNYGFDPLKKTGLFRYRMIQDRAHLLPGSLAGDTTLVNWPQNDYLLGNLVDVSPGEASRHVARAKQLSLSLLYWLQTECPRPDGGAGWKGLRLRPDLMGTEDGLAMAPYIREARRIRAELTVTENHVGTDARREATGIRTGPVSAEIFPDSVGIGSYAIDLHPSTGGDNYIDVPALPFQIPLGSLLPRRVENLLPAAKNIGTTHITNGCYRLHPVEWNIGEAVGELVAYCLEKKQPPRAVRAKPALLSAFQHQLATNGIRLAWPG